MLDNAGSGSQNGQILKADTAPSDIHSIPIIPSSRKYCDNCEDFSHDTNECSKNESIPQPPPTRSALKPRVFCDECDMFLDENCTIHS